MQALLGIGRFDLLLLVNHFPSAMPVMCPRGYVKACTYIQVDLHAPHGCSLRKALGPPSSSLHSRGSPKPPRLIFLRPQPILFFHHFFLFAYNTLAHLLYSALFFLAISTLFFFLHHAFHIFKSRSFPSVFVRAYIVLPHSFASSVLLLHINIFFYFFKQSLYYYIRQHMMIRYWVL